MVTPGMGSLTGAAKLEAVTKLMKQLTSDLENANLASEQRDAALEELKVYGRDPRNADPIFTKQGIETLTRHAFNSPSTTTSHNALRCLANAMLITATTRQMFVDLGYEAKACAQLKRDTFDDEFLISRVIFLTTYGTNIDLVKLIDEYHLADTIIGKLAKHANSAKNGTGKSKAVLDPMEGMALSETLKLMFNVSHFCSKRVDSFSPTIPHVLTLLINLDIPSTQPLDPPFGPLVNAMVNLKVESNEAQSSLYPENEPNSVVERLIQLLDLSLTKYVDTELEQTTTPLVSVLRSIYEHAPESVRQYIRKKLLPTEDDRQKILGRGETLSSRLLRSSTNAMTPQLRDAISHLLFEMSDKDASKFVENVGYGFASGFLFQNNLAVPENTSTSAEDGRKAFNPVTGQFLDKEKFPEEPEMSEEEKEKEAERLFVLFERLKKTGIVDIQNPVEQAVREGRFEQVKDDDRIEELE